MKREWDEAEKDGELKRGGKETTTTIHEVRDGEVCKVTKRGERVSRPPVDSLRGLGASVRASYHGGDKGIGSLSVRRGKEEPGGMRGNMEEGHGGGEGEKRDLQDGGVRAG